MAKELYCTWLYHKDGRAEIFEFDGPDFEMPAGWADHPNKWSDPDEPADAAPARPRRGRPRKASA